MSHYNVEGLADTAPVWNFCTPDEPLRMRPGDGLRSLYNMNGREPVHDVQELLSKGWAVRVPKEYSSGHYFCITPRGIREYLSR